MRAKRPVYSDSVIFTLITLKWRKFGKDASAWKSFWAMAQGALGRPVRRLEDLSGSDIKTITARLREMPEYTPRGQGAIQW